MCAGFPAWLISALGFESCGSPGILISTSTLVRAWFVRLEGKRRFSHPSAIYRIWACSAPAPPGPLDCEPGDPSRALAYGKESYRYSGSACCRFPSRWFVRIRCSCRALCAMPGMARTEGARDCASHPDEKVVAKPKRWRRRPRGVQSIWVMKDQRCPSMSTALYSLYP